MRIPVLPPLLLLCFATCVAPVQYEPWSADTLRLARSVEESGESLTTAMLAHFTPGSTEYRAARNLGATLQQQYAQQVMAWRALELYLADVNAALARRDRNTRPVHGISKAFHELHIHLLQTGISGSFGISVEQHKETTMRIMQANSVVAAMEAAHPVVAILCDHLAQSCRELVGELEAGETVAMALLNQDWQAELAVREILVKRQENLRNALAMVAAGAGETRGNPTAALNEVEQLLAAGEDRFQEYVTQRRSLSETFRAHIDFARKSSHAILEWGIGHREMMKAVQRGDGSPNLRLFEASVHELSGED